MEELDPVVVALQQEIQSGNLPRHHIFYKVLRNALEFAQKSSDPRKQFTHDKDVTLFSETLAFHGKDKVMNLLRGAGFHGQQKGGTFEFKWKNWNLPFVPSKSTRSKDKAGYTTKNGIIKSLLISYLLLAQLEESGVQPLIDNPNLRVIPVCLATDGMKILSESLCSLRDFLKDVNPGFNSFLKLVATLTLVVENFFSQMRSRNHMPTALEFAYLFAPTIRESLKQLTDTGFVYYTSPHSYYEQPDEMKLPF